MASRIIAAIKQGRTTSGKQIEDEQSLQSLLATTIDTTELLKFSSYARGYWARHTIRFWHKPCGDSYPLFLSLLASLPEHLDVPWKDLVGQTRQSFQWARGHQHFGLLPGFLLSSEAGTGDGAFAGLGPVFVHTLELYADDDPSPLECGPTELLSRVV